LEGFNAVLKLINYFFDWAVDTDGKDIYLLPNTLFTASEASD